MAPGTIELPEKFDRHEAGVLTKRLRKISSKFHRRMDGTPHAAEIARAIDWIETVTRDFHENRKRIELAAFRAGSDAMSEKKASAMTKAELIEFAKKKYAVDLDRRLPVASLRKQVVALDDAADQT